jgi:hypothetical protein
MTFYDYNTKGERIIEKLDYDYDTPREIKDLAKTLAAAYDIFGLYADNDLLDFANEIENRIYNDLWYAVQKWLPDGFDFEIGLDYLGYNGEIDIIDAETGLSIFND